MDRFKSQSTNNGSGKLTNFVLFSLLFLCIVSKNQLGARSSLSLSRLNLCETKAEERYEAETGNPIIGHVILRRAIFDRKRLFIAGDIHVHPGPSDNGSTAQKKRLIRFPCLLCGKGVTARSRAVSCDSCDEWTHIQCTNGKITRERYNSLVTDDDDFSYNCGRCSLEHGFSELPFHNNNDELVPGGGNVSVQRVVDDGAEVCDGEGEAVGRGGMGDMEASQPASSVCDSTSTATRSISASDMAKFHRKGMAFIHLNIRSLLPKISELAIILNQTKASILAVSETHLDNSVGDNISSLFT